MFRTIIIAIYVVVMLILSLPYLLVTKLARILSLTKIYNTLIESFVVFFTRSVLKLAGVRVDVKGLENLPNRNVLFVSNHQSIVDIPIVLGYIPGNKSFIAKKETAKIPIINWWMKEINCVFLDRKNIRQGMKDMARAREFLQTGTSMVIYPEGTRSKSDDMAPFKKGSLKIAFQAKVPIVPIAISGSYLALEKHKKVKKAQVKLEIGQPIYIEELSLENQKELSKIVYQRVNTILDNIKTP